jgi:hypothetical protein
LRLRQYAAAGLPEEVAIPLDEWASPATQQRLGPDVIVFVIAPHHQWLRSDRQYHRDLLTSLRGRAAPPGVVFAFNLFCTPVGGGLQATEQQLKQVREFIEAEWKRFHSEDASAPVVEISAHDGTGVRRLLEVILSRAPAEKTARRQPPRRPAEAPRRLEYLTDSVPLTLELAWANGRLEMRGLASAVLAWVESDFVFLNRAEKQLGPLLGPFGDIVLSEPRHAGGLRDGLAEAIAQLLVRYGADQVRLQLKIRVEGVPRPRPQGGPDWLDWSDAKP